MTTRVRNKRHVIVAAVAGAALLVGGSTYALWFTSADVNGGQVVTAGDLDLAGGTMKAWDVSTDRGYDTDVKTAASAGFSEIMLMLPGEADQPGDEPIKGLAVNLSTWKIVPGDTVALTFPYKVTAKGDNLVASLTVPGATKLFNVTNKASSLKDEEPAAINLDYQMFGADGQELGEITSLLDADQLVAYVQPLGSREYTADKPVVETDEAGTVVLTMVLYVTFKSVDDRVGANEILTMANQLTATVAQVR
jgi:alternate signal-mediated exported protein